MEVLSMRLVLHEIDNDYIQKNCCPNVIKGNDFAPNCNFMSNGMFAQDIESSDLVISLSDVNNNDKYGYLFIDIQTATEGNKAYTIKTVIFDDRLNEETIGVFIYNTLYCLVNKQLRQDRIIANGNYPFSQHTFFDTYKHVANEIIKAFILNRDGFVANQDYMQLLQTIGEKMSKE